MNPCAIHQRAYVCREEMRREAVACPRPRRLASGLDHPIRPVRWPFVNQTDNDLKAGSEVLDMILTKDGCGIEQHSEQIPSSPPFFCGLPPSRVSNPLIKDERFREENFAPFSQVSPANLHLSSSPNSASRKGGCVRASFGNKPAVRIEGFDCLNGDSRNCGIPAWA
ncbi:hypothetical protein MLD38_007517 [Melastoma candidum]|uniref:Uncharacterized protein n=1 Tax=Melastoma candidum TaxID=119954 RepID=A0ACB9RR35_9MYRT|nr:hypothetical protein MLD38_007517 [Melastoma candidum]